MKPDRKVKNYAGALLSIAQKTGKIHEVNEALQVLAELFRKDPIFRIFFLTRRIESEEKFSILKDLFKDSCHTITLEFLTLLIDRKETGLLGQIAKYFDKIQMAALNKIPVRLFTSETLDDDEYQGIKTAIETATKKSLEFSSEVDSNLLGGIKMRVGNTFMDGSIMNQMERLRLELIQS